jgi:hypothetical protein
MSLIQDLGVTLADLMPLEHDVRFFTLGNQRYIISSRLADAINTYARKRRLGFHDLVRMLLEEIHAQAN